MDFFNGMDTILKTFWFIAIPASLIFAVQTVMTFMGADASDGIDADFDSNLDGGDSPFQIFSLRNLINFLLGFSWSGISFYNSIANKNILIGLSVLVGIAFVYLFFLIIKQVIKLAEDNSFKLTEAINKTAEVYLSIPGNMSGKGKVLVSVKGSTRELGAITAADKIETGTMVKVISIQNDNILVVEKI